MRALLFLLSFALAFSAGADDDDLRAPFITTPDRVIERMLELAGTGASDLVMDLGSGDGRIVLAAAQKFGARGVGIEIDARLVEQSRGYARAANIAERVSFVHGNVLTADISQASVVTIYLLPGLLDKLKPRFVYELRPGTRIVTHGFRMTGWEPDRSDTVPLAERHPGQGMLSKVYLWIVPAEARGLWRGGGYELRIEQNYQQLDIEGAREARLSGREISWQLGDARFTGVVEGDRMAGELAAPDGRRQALVLLRVRP